jgi:hypothetical protein
MLGAHAVEGILPGDKVSRRQVWRLVSNWVGKWAEQSCGRLRGRGALKIEDVRLKIWEPLLQIVQNLKSSIFNLQFFSGYHPRLPQLIDGPAIIIRDEQRAG